MKKKELLEKISLNKNELNEYYNYQFESMEFPWLNGVREWIEKKYNVKVMTILYEFTTNNIHKFILYLYSYDQHKNIPLVGDNFWEYHSEEIEAIISNYFKAEDGEKIECKFGNSTFITCARRYLFSLLCKLDEIERKAKLLFERLNPIYITLGGSIRPIICVFETKEEAKDFMLSRNYSTIRCQIFDFLKPYDDYNVLNKDDIKIFVDHKENKERIPMYSRWVQEMPADQFELYEKSIIDS